MTAAVAGIQSHFRIPPRLAAFERAFHTGIIHVSLRPGQSIEVMVVANEEIEGAFHVAYENFIGDKL